MRRLLRQTRVRLALAYAAAFSVVALVAAGALWLALSRAEYSAVDDSLATQARSIEAVLVSGGGQAGAGSLPAEASGGAAVAALLFDRDARLLDHSGQALPPNALVPIVRRAASSSSARFETKTISAQAQRVSASRVDLANGNVRVLVLARPLAEANQLLSSTALVLVGGMAMLVVAASVLGYGLAGTALRPVREITAAARTFSEQDLHRRITLDLPPDELGQLANTFNDMLGRLEAAFESLRRFTADAAHELRAPLTLIRTEAEVTLSRPRSAEQYRASLRTMLSEAERLGRLADQLLMLARADAGALSTQMSEVDLSALAEDAVNRWESLAAKRGVALVAHAPGRSPVRGDPDLLQRLLDNLVDNALRYSPKGGEVVVRVDAGERRRELSVADSGPGVPVEMKPVLFQRFTRADRARGRDTGGAGLGLALCAAIAEIHDGSISLDDGPGRGARFVVRLPAAPAHRAAKATSRHEPAPGVRRTVLK